MPKQKSVLDVLHEDHERIQHLLERLEGTSERGKKTRDKLIEEIHRELEVHTAIEEEIVYPAVRQAADDHDGEQMHFEFVEEHYLAGEVELPRMLELDVESIDFTARCVVLKELLTHHIEEEESRMFSRARELFDHEQLASLGGRVLERKRELMRELKKAA